jgi:maltooligosyltrehalose trehalohydrolase
MRIHQLAAPGAYRALTALWLLGPGTPMFFQGQEFAADAPFLFFADHEPELAKAVRKGRFEFLKSFPSVASAEMSAALNDPEDIATFERCKIDWRNRESHREVYDLHRDLLKLRREDPVFRAQRGDRIFGAVLSSDAFVLRYFGDDHDDRLVLVNLGRDLPFNPAPEPLLAPPENGNWRILWSSESPRYGGNGTPEIDGEMKWRILGRATVVLAPERAK